ncbi:hypothetical protein [Paenibacillus sp. YYML68]|uniref:hypothetical protein n=1 Tax=Paenibacillus sp. YYML68 TaxID=2909250 RepID=UPI0024923F06|nr:hypothetical protein [Paenibacillus sp. YYML68]
MEKRLNRTDYVFAITFIFMLVVALGAFFYGLRLGQERAAAKYEELLVEKKAENNGLTAYHQQYLVSFYHTIYQPYREFHKAWFDKLDTLQANQSADASLIVKDLAKQSQEVYDTLSQKAAPDSSPLLKESQQNYMRSLKLTSEALRTFTSKANAMPGYELVSQFQSDAYLSEARNFALLAEKQYYDAMLKWYETVSPQFKSIDVTATLAIKDWNALTLNMKNAYIANLFAGSAIFPAYTPQDMSARVDDLIASGQAKNMNLTNVPQIVNTLIATDAVRSGDFQRLKNKYYNGQTLPQLPFF